MRISFEINVDRYHFRKWLHRALKWHDWEYQRLDDPLLGEYYKKHHKVDMKWCHFCGAHATLTYKNR